MKILYLIVLLLVPDPDKKWFNINVVYRNDELTCVIYGKCFNEQKMKATTQWCDMFYKGNLCFTADKTINNPVCC